MLFSSVPASLQSELQGGRSGVDIALELYQRFQEARLNNIYLMPPIKRGGTRNYDAAEELLSKIVKVYRRLPSLPGVFFILPAVS